MPGPSELRALAERVAAWPPEAQEELASVARDIESELAAGDYQATTGELRGIDRGLRDAAEGRFASEAEVEAVFAKHRGK